MLLLSDHLIAALAEGGDIWLARITTIATGLTMVTASVFAGLKSVGVGRQVDAMREESDKRHRTNTAALAQLSRRLDKLDNGGDHSGGKAAGDGR